MHVFVYHELSVFWPFGVSAFGIISVFGVWPDPCDEYYYDDVDANNDNGKFRVVNLTRARRSRSVWWQVTTSKGIYLCVSFH